MQVRLWQFLMGAWAVAGMWASLIIVAGGMIVLLSLVVNMIFNMTPLLLGLLVIFVVSLVIGGVWNVHKARQAEREVDAAHS